MPEYFDELPNPGEPITKARTMVEILAILSEIYPTGGLDSEVDVIHKMLDDLEHNVKEGDYKSCWKAIEQARRIRDNRQSYH